MVHDATLGAIGSELESLSERLHDAAYDALRAQVRRGGKPAKSDPDVVREKLLARARNAVERARALVEQAERLSDTGAVDPDEF